MTYMQRIKGSLILILTAIVWGSGFVAQSAGMEYIGANTFNGIRMLIGSFVLLPIAFRKPKNNPTAKTENNKELLKSGIICGIILCAASTIQTWGLAFTTPGKSGFITAMYMIFVPIISIFLGKKITVRTIVCAFIALCGMYMLCMTGNQGRINFGDILTLICAVLFSIHIIFVDNLSSDVNAIKFASLQFFVCGIINIVLMFLIENPSIEIIKQCTVPILYSGLFACGIGYTLQPIGQRYAEPTAASIMMSLESVFALIFGIIILHDSPTVLELLGCVVMFVAIIIIQLPDNLFKREVKYEEK